MIGSGTSGALRREWLVSTSLRGPGLGPIAVSIRTSKKEVVVPEEDEDCLGEGLRKILVTNP
jgi:hypothetical protein